MDFYGSRTYTEDLKLAINSIVDIEKLRNSSIMITGATGLVGSYIVDILLAYNVQGANIKVYAIGRNKERLENRFAGAKTESLFYIEHDVNNYPDFACQADYVIHAASNSYPAAFSNDPVGTIMGNIQGTKYLLDYCKNNNSKRVLYISSGEVYGEGDVSLEGFEESYSGYVDPTQPRSCYPNSKRTAETLCSSYRKQYGLDTVIVRPCHTYGPNVTSSDNRASVQFINNVLNGDDIILKSAGNQMRSYCYITDCASAILTVLIKGVGGQAYNIANPKARITIAGFAGIVAEQTGHKVVYVNPDEVAIAERTPISRQVLESRKLEDLGWEGLFCMEEGIAHTLAILAGK